MAAGLVLLKKGRQTEDLLADLSNWLDVFMQVGTAPNGLDALRVLMEYVSRVANVDPDNVREFARAIGPTAEEAYVTAAQKLAEQGRAEGRADGRAELVEQADRDAARCTDIHEQPGSLAVHRPTTGS
jgi:hypothetical protein